MALTFSFLNVSPSAAAASNPSQVIVPSGQPVTLYEVLLDQDPGALWLRLRFVAPQIAREGGIMDHQQSVADMDHLCHAVGLPYMREHQVKPERIAVSLSDRPVPFGVQDASVTQFFEVYRPSDDACIWEGL